MGVVLGPAQQLKRCPKCGNASPIVAQTCQKCGHLYRTKFATAVAQPVQPAPNTALSWAAYAALALLGWCSAILGWLVGARLEAKDDAARMERFRLAAVYADERLAPLIGQSGRRLEELGLPVTWTGGNVLHFARERHDFRRIVSCTRGFVTLEDPERGYTIDVLLGEDGQVADYALKIEDAVPFIAYRFNPEALETEFWERINIAPPMELPPFRMQMGAGPYPPETIEAEVRRLEGD